MVTLTNAVREFFKKLFFQISAVRMGEHAYMDATPMISVCKLAMMPSGYSTFYTEILLRLKSTKKWVKRMKFYHRVNLRSYVYSRHWLWPLLI